MSATASPLFVALEAIGTVAFAISGVMAAGRARMDWLGAFALAIVVAIGGGTIRDVLLGRLPVGWLQEPWPVLVAAATAAVVILALRFRPATDLEDWSLVTAADALGLSAFVVVGTDIGLRSGLSPFLAVLLGVVTGVGGGVIRDVLTDTRPMVLVGQVYAVAGLVGGAAFVLLTELDTSAQVAVWLSVALTFTLRMVAVRRDWNLPKTSPDASAD